MAHKKGGGSSRNGRDSNSQRLGVKRFGGQVRQVGQYFSPPTWHEVLPGIERRHWQG